MKLTRNLMDMHITVEVVDPLVTAEDFDVVYDYFGYIDNTFSTFKETSEISRINDKQLREADYSDDMKTILALCEQTRKETDGYFDIRHEGKLDPSGMVKGWAIWKAAEILKKRGRQNFYVDAGGDIQTFGKNAEGKPWKIGIRNPFKNEEIVKVLAIEDRGVATSGTSRRGQHIYNPHNRETKLEKIVSMTVIGPNVCEADRLATPAFAMEEKGVAFIEELPGFEAYAIDRMGIATYTSGFNKFVSL